MTLFADIAQRISTYSPMVSLGLLLVLSQLLPNHVEIDDRAPEHQAEVAAAIAGAPRFIGAWTGVDVPVPAEAQKLLRPNAILSRTYKRPGVPSVQLLLVHCTDARDMLGHYPPVCYPSSGWLPAEPDGTSEIMLRLSGVARPFRLYEFQRLREHGASERIRIFNAFIGPDGTVTREMDDINRQSERLSVSVQGVAQLQLVTAGQMPYDDAVAAAEELLAGISGLADALGVERGLDVDFQR